MDSLTTTVKANLMCLWVCKVQKCIPVKKKHGVRVETVKS